MKLTNGKTTLNITNPEHINAFKSSGWVACEDMQLINDEEVKDEVKDEVIEEVAEKKKAGRPKKVAD